MDKILLIIGREYWVRVKKKSFLWVTFLVPIIIASLYGMMIYLIINPNKFGDLKRVQVIDSSGVYSSRLKDSPKLNFIKNLGESLPQSKKNIGKNKVDYILYIPTLKDKALVAMGGQALSPQGIQLIGEKEASIQDQEIIQQQLDEILKNKTYAQAGIDTAKLNHLKSEVKVQSTILTKEGEKKGNSVASFGIGLVGAIIIYMFILIYGIQVMRGVMEEKTSRVVEVIISSVRPFQLMMGKIIGIALVGLTQFILWIFLTMTVTTINSSNLNLSGPSKTMEKGGASEILEALSSQNYPYLITCFLFYFLSGYLLYAALFAAVGSAVDSETETQQFIAPITIPLVFAIILSSNYVVMNPDTSLSFWLSIIPLFAPVVMMVRLPFHPPIWQVLLSMFLMIPGFLGTVWMAGKIYRTGILLYGKKVNFKELYKWLFYKN